MSDTSNQDRETLTRWRLVLGQQAEQHGMFVEGNAEVQGIEELIGFHFEKADGYRASATQSSGKQGW